MTLVLLRIFFLFNGKWHFTCSTALNLCRDIYWEIIAICYCWFWNRCFCRVTYFRWPKTCLLSHCHQNTTCFNFRCKILPNHRARYRVPQKDFHRLRDPASGRRGECTQPRKNLFSVLHIASHCTVLTKMCKQSLLIDDASAIPYLFFCSMAKGSLLVLQF